jgi:hypothetical protein
MEKNSSDCVDLDDACKMLVKSRAVQALIKKTVGEKTLQEALRQMRDGNLDDDLGADIHNLLIDTIRNEAEEVWSGVIHQPHDDYPIQVNGYHGVYWVWAMEYDPVGYFLDKKSAISYAMENWEIS